MQANPNNDSCIRILALVDQFVSGELQVVDRELVAAHVPACPVCARVVNERVTVRSTLRRAAASIAAPAWLADAIRNDRSTSVINAGAIDPVPLTRVAGGAHATRRWVYAIAASVIVAFGAWLVIRDNDETPQIAKTTPAADQELAAALHVGIAGHIKCVIKYGFGTMTYDDEAIRRMLNEDYAELAHIARTAAPDYQLTVGHHCTFLGRDFVHLIMKKDTAVISLELTLRKPGDKMPSPHLAVSTSPGVPVFASAHNGFEVAGFESGRYVIFMVSNLPPDKHIDMAVALATPVAGFLLNVDAVAFAEF